MEEKFDFKRIGKRMPYTVPKGFSDDIEKNVWNNVKNNITETKTIRHYLYWGSISGGLLVASILLLFIWHNLPSYQKKDDFKSLEQVFLNLSDTDQNYLFTIYQNDLFINE